MADISFKNWPFFWGVATNAFQIEGARLKGNRTESIWDDFTKKNVSVPDALNSPEREVASIAESADYYNKYKTDVNIMHHLGINLFVYAIDWTRIIPTGNFVNNEGVRFYEKAFRAIKNKAITPVIILFHWDTPMWLEKLGGIPSTKEVKKHFRFYVATVFKRLGKLCDFWLVSSENWAFAYYAYIEGLFPPNYKNDYLAFVKVLHNLNVMAAIAREEFDKAKDEGYIKARAWLGTNFDFCPGINLHNNKKLDNLYRDWNLHLLLEPLFKGTYPKVFIEFINEKKLYFKVNLRDIHYLKKHPLDWISWNFYRPQYFTEINKPLVLENEKNPSVLHSSGKYLLVWPKKFNDEKVAYTKWSWLIKPEYLLTGLKEIQKYYPDTPILIGENGCGDFDTVEVLNDGTQVVCDYDRINFLKSHIQQVMKGRAEKLNIVGYCVWTYCDIFSPSAGYRKRYGLVRVDFEDKKLHRYPKLSYVWYKNVIDSDGKTLKEINDKSLTEQFKLIAKPENWDRIIKYMK